MISVNDLIGKAFADGGRGPEAFDCYGVLREVYRRHGVEIPDVNVSVYAAMTAQGIIDAETASNRWERIDFPIIPCAVLMSPHAGFAQHVGVWLGKHILHTRIGQGVIAERAGALKHKIQGFYRYVPDPDSRT
jgi:cell wall-associated NlpC family hydrolase